LKKVLISGGGGKFANQLVQSNTKYELVCLSKQEMDVTNLTSILEALEKHKPDCFIHTAAYTRPLSKHEDKPDVSILNNIVGTSNVTIACIRNNTKLVYISTDHVYKGDKGNYAEDSEVLPSNKYGWSKMGGECAVTMYDNSLIFRASMCEEPFPHPKAVKDAKKSLIYQADAAIIVLSLLDKTGIINLGGPPQTIYAFVKDKKPEIGAIYLKDIDDVYMPTDTTLNITKMKRLLEHE
tara:strand:- start:7566 stop:8279 length:714 start_codon:yes stop_codon:yes gene_type:complete